MFFTNFQLITWLAMTCKASTGLCLPAISFLIALRPHWLTTLFLKYARRVLTVGTCSFCSLLLVSSGHRSLHGSFLLSKSQFNYFFSVWHFLIKESRAAIPPLIVPTIALLLYFLQWLLEAWCSKIRVRTGLPPLAAGQCLRSSWSCLSAFLHYQEARSNWSGVERLCHCYGDGTSIPPRPSHVAPVYAN